MLNILEYGGTSSSISRKSSDYVSNSSLTQEDLFYLGCFFRLVFYMCLCFVFYGFNHYVGPSESYPNHSIIVFIAFILLMIVLYHYSMGLLYDESMLLTNSTDF
jgi:hypothetical protein